MAFVHFLNWENEGLSKISLFTFLKIRYGGFSNIGLFQSEFNPILAYIHFLDMRFKGISHICLSLLLYVHFLDKRYLGFSIDDFSEIVLSLFS